MNQQKQSLKQNISDLMWLTKFTFSVDKKIFILLNIVIIFKDNIHIVNTYVGALIINILTSGTRELSSDIIILLAITFIVNMFLNYSYDWRDYLKTRFNQLWELKAWEAFLSKTSSLDFQYLESPEYNIIMHKVKEAVNWRANVATQEIPHLLSGLIGILLIISIFFTINPVFILLVLIPEILRFVTNKKFGYDLYSIWDSHGETKHHAWYAQHSLEKSDVLREAKVYHFATSILNRYRTEVMLFMSEAIGKLKRRLSLMGLASLLNAVNLIFIQIWLILQVLNQNISIGAYTFYLGNITTAGDALNTVQSSFSSLIEQLPYVNEFRRYLNLKDIVVKPEKPIRVEQESPKIEFRNVSFKYPETDKYVIKNMNFTIMPGEKIALVGENGAGKTTIIKLLARFYDVTDGEILINNINIKELDLSSYYKLWGVLFQSFAKLWFSVRENIGIGNLEDINNLELIKEAARKADADKFINELPVGYETLLSKDFKNGTELSGGQWQKIGIARAMFANPKLIVLDEPTSALDALAEAEVFENINKLSKDSTVVVISHRFATVRNANKILVVENGEISEKGTHEELMQNNGLYRKMFTAQAEGYK